VSYEIVQKSAFLEDFILLERSVQKKVPHAIKQITENPFGSGSKKLKRYSNVYRWRVGDYRLCYSVGTNCISLLAIGPRSEIYARYHLEADVPAGVDFESASVGTVPDDPIPAQLPEGGDTAAEVATAAPDRSELVRELLRLREIPEEYHKRILKCRTADDLLSLSIPQEYISTILHVQAPPQLEEVAAQPALKLNQPEDLDRWIEGSLTGFLLRLDQEQEKAAAKALKGPALVKGGAGTGKSLVALYRLRNMFSPEAQEVLFGGAKPRALFVTFTNSLTNTSHQLLRKLLSKSDIERVDVMTLDRLAVRLARGVPKDRVGRVRDTIVLARTMVKFSGSEEEQQRSHASLAKLTPEYLADELEWVIDGRGISSLAEYLETPRPGRGIAFDLRTRRAVWELHRQWRSLLKSRQQATYGQVQLSALEAARSMPMEKKYDCVIVDEAQDLKPVGIRLALALCKSAEGFYMTADEAQSIYGRGYSWKAVSDDLRIQGRVVTLRRNYRGTAELQAATDHFVRVSNLGEPGRELEAVRQGQKPVAIEYQGDALSTLPELLRKVAAEQKAPLSSAAVLVRNHELGLEVARRLTAEGITASFFESKEVDLDAPCVKVMTVHTSKGLEFPIVVVAGLRNGVFPPKRDTIDPKEAAEQDLQERRLFHVALTRAMRRLYVLYPKVDPSDFIADLDAQLWDWRRA
jgi:superfamily I DNA/RNA helicase/mRNA-degrading endonuclease RelE of RelBE toxin-antitoxin system